MDFGYLFMRINYSIMKFNFFLDLCVSWQHITFIKRNLFKEIKINISHEK